MNPLTHLLAGWVVANTADLGPRDRLLVTLSGVVPDVDGVGAIAEIATKDSTTPLYWWSEYHHVLFHNIGFGLALSIVVALGAVRRWTTAVLALLVFHLHMLGDLVGSRGPDGYQWPIPYLLPFSQHLKLTWEGQWELNAWPNILVTIALLGIALLLAWKRGYSPLEMASKKADLAFVGALRRRFGQPGGSHA